MKFLSVNFEKSTFTIFVKYLQKNEMKGKIVISDLHLDCVYHDWDVDLNEFFDAWVAPFNEKLKNILINSKKFPGLLLKLYNEKGRLLQVEKIELRNSTPIINKAYTTPEFDITGPSYVDFFYGDLCKNIDTSGVVIDAGANVGFFTLFCKENGAKRIYSIEPDPMPFFYLEKNFKYDKEIITINKALTDFNDFVSFDISLGGSVGSTISKYANYEYKKNILVEAIKISSILKIEEKINLLKLDIEGSEFDVIKSMYKYQFTRINQMFIEFHDDPKVIEHILLENGYRVEYRDSNRESTSGFIYAKRL